MTQIAPSQSINLYRTATTAAPQIDMESRVIKNVIMAKVGEAKGHGHWIEQSFIDEMVAFARKKMKDGVKSAFGHNYDNMGKQLGRFQNVRVEGDCAIGDLHIYEAADDSPTHQGMGTWVLKLGKEDNKAIMSSIKFVQDHYYQYDENKKKIKVWYHDPENGWISPNRKMKIYVAFKELRGCDIVDEGAITQSLYGAGDSMTIFNDIINQKEFLPLLDAHYEEFTVLNDFYATKQKKNIFTQFTEFFAKDKETETERPEDTADDNPLNTQLAEKDTKITELTSSLSDKEVELKTANDKVTQLQTDHDKKIAELNAKIEELSNEPADITTDGETENELPASLPGQSWKSNPINQKASKIKEDGRHSQS